MDMDKWGKHNTIKIGGKAYPVQPLPSDGDRDKLKGTIDYRHTSSHARTTPF